MSAILSVLPMLALALALILISRLGKQMYVKENQPAVDAFKKRFALVESRASTDKQCIHDLGGSVDGLNVRLQTILIQGRNQHYPYTTITIYLPSELPRGLRISKKGVVSTLKNTFGQNIRTGNTRLDEAVLIQADQEDAALALFQNANIALATLDFFDRYPAASVADGQLTVKMPRDIDVGTELMLLSFVKFAQILSGRRPFKAFDQPLLDAGMLSFEDSARLVEEKLAQRGRNR